MPPILPLLLAFAALILSAEGFHLSIQAPWALLLLAPLPHLCARIARRLLLRGRFSSAQRALQALQHAPSIAFWLAVLLCGWLQTLEQWIGRPLGLMVWPDLWVLLAIGPYILYEVLAIDARSRLQARDRENLARYRRYQWRALLGLLVPLALFLAVSTAFGASELTRIRLDEVGIYSVAYSVLLLLGFAALLPWILTRAWDTRPLPQGPLRAVFDKVAQHANFKARDIYLWNTEGSMANAAIVGLGSRLRVVLFSDALLSQLDARQLAAVYAHEIAHAKRGHVVLFALWAIAAFLGGDLLGRHFFPEDPWMQVACLLGSLVLWFLFFGWLSRRCELEADLFASQLFGTHEPIASALEAVGGRLRDVAGWRHFSTAKRIAFLERAAQDPAIGRRLERGLSWLFAVGLLLALSTGALFLMREWKRMPADLIQADLRLGHFQAAVQRADTGVVLDLAQQSLVDAARLVDRDGLSSAELEMRALEAALDLRLADAQRLLLLGAARGDWELAELALALEPEGGALPARFQQRWGALK